jgi:putative salt-induced outer membrane protein
MARSLHLNKSALLVSTLLLSPVVMAHEVPEEEEDTGPWSGIVSFGYLGTSGNTENTNLNGKFEVGYESGKWSHLATGYAIAASEDNDTTAEAYGAGWKTVRALNDPNFVFLQLDYRRDRFSGYPEQLSETIGYGRRVIDTGKHLLNAEIGAGWKQSERSDGVDENSFILRGGLFYEWAFSETAKFTQDLIVESGGGNTYLESISAVKAALVGDLALVASYTIKSNSDVPPGIEDTDTYTALSLEYAF